MAHILQGPRAYLETRPTFRSVKFGGRFINLKEMARCEHMEHSYLTRVINGSRRPSLEYLSRIVAALQMTTDDFLACVEERKAFLHAQLLRRVS